MQGNRFAAGWRSIPGPRSRHIIEGMTDVERNAIEGRALLLYDGVCALCNGVVQFLMKRDRLDRFRYAPLQSSLGREVLARFDIHSFPMA